MHTRPPVSCYTVSTSVSFCILPLWVAVLWLTCKHWWLIAYNPITYSPIDRRKVVAIGLQWLLLGQSPVVCVCVYELPLFLKFLYLYDSFCHLTLAQNWNCLVDVIAPLLSTIPKLKLWISITAIYCYFSYFMDDFSYSAKMSLAHHVPSLLL